MHLLAFLVALPAAAALLVIVDGAARRVTAAVYLAGLLTCFGVSATYHLLGRYPYPRLNGWLRRVDHAAIFLLVAGTFTPVAASVTAGAARLALLGGVWASSLTGLALKLLRRAWRFATSLYLVIGWFAVALLPLLLGRAGGFVTTLVLLGGIIYTVGAVLFLTGRPRRPARRFGAHEIWHSFTVAAAAVHFWAVALLLG